MGSSDSARWCGCEAAQGGLVLGAALLLAAVLLPFAVDTRYVITQMTVFFIWATVVTQWNLVFGVAGVFSLAQMALFAVGGYVTAMLGFYTHLSLWLAMPVAALATVAVSMLIGLACLRLRGPYVALLTLAIAQVMYVLIVTDTNCFTTADSGCMPLFSGVRGITRFGDLGFRSLFGGRWIIADYFVGLALLRSPRSSPSSSSAARSVSPFGRCATTPTTLGPAA